MKTPAFWQSRNAISTLLLPLASVYDTVSTLRRAFTPAQNVGVPVICVGNLTAGGAGKTPVAIAIGKILKQKNIHAFFLSRGYGGSLRGPVLVDEKIHSARQVGDEPLLLAKILPTIVCKDRAAGARFAVQKGARAIVMDDGFQNPSLAKTLSLLVVDGERGFGNFRLIPAGPLREAPVLGLRRAHGVIIMNPTSATPPIDHPFILTAKTEPRPEAQIVKGRKIFAFCGIAYPEKFIVTLTSLGAKIEDHAFFADHHAFSENDVRDIIDRAKAVGAELATTAKDAARLPVSFRSRMHVIDIEAVFDDPGMLEAALDDALKPHA